MTGIWKGMGTEEKVKRCVKQFQQGDKQAFDKIYDLTFSLMMYVARVHLYNRQYAEDVVNEAYLTFVKNLNRIDSNNNVLGWLLVVVKNIALRFNQKGREIAVDDIDTISSSYDIDFEGKLLLKDTIVNLPDEMCELFTMYYIKDQTLREIAKAKNKSKTMIWKEVQKLNALLKKGLGIE